MAPDITSQVKKSQPANDLSLDFANDEAWARSGASLQKPQLRRLQAIRLSPTIEVLQKSDFRDRALALFLTKSE